MKRCIYLTQSPLDVNFCNLNLKVNIFQPGSPTLRVLHLSDLHVDMEYKIGEEADCDEPQCCRPQGDGQVRNFR